MHLTNCKHPRLIVNKYTQESMYVPCGMCSYCRMRYSLQWKSRLIQEFKDNTNAVFFTLTYRDDKVPLAFLNGKTMYSDDWDDELDVSSILSLNNDNSDFLYSRPSFPFAVKRDIQLFLKRLRKAAFSDYGTKIRYYIISEYGPKTLRPHYHGILFYDGDALTPAVRDLISSKWQLGFVDSKFANEGSADYVSAYCSGSVSLPLLYSFKPFKPFVLASRKNPIGFKYFGKTNESSLFFACEPTYITKDREGEHEEYLSEYYRNKLFPKCVGFNEASRDVRKALYSLYDRSYLAPVQVRYNVEIVNKDNDVKLSIDINGQHYVRNFTEGAYKYAVALSKRVLTFCQGHNITLENWLDNVELFHNRLEKRLLKEQLFFADHFARTEFGTLSPLIHQYSANMLQRRGFYSLLANHGFQFISASSDSFDYQNTKDYYQLCYVGDKFIDDCRRVKSHNDNKSYRHDKSFLGYTNYYFGSS